MKRVSSHLISSGRRGRRHTGRRFERLSCGAVVEVDWTWFVHMPLLRWEGHEHGNTAKEARSAAALPRQVVLKWSDDDVRLWEEVRVRGTRAAKRAPHFPDSFDFASNFELDPAQEHGAKEAPLRPFPTKTHASSRRLSSIH